VELLVMIFVPFPLGFLVRNRLAAFLAYVAVHAFVFTFQTLMLLVEWAGGSGTAFGRYPDAETSEIFAYGVVNLVIYAAGLGLVYLGHRVGSRRRERRDGTVHLDPVPG
jgi:predicted Na+-dependent transporter